MILPRRRPCTVGPIWVPFLRWSFAAPAVALDQKGIGGPLSFRPDCHYVGRTPGLATQTLCRTGSGKHKLQRSGMRLRGVQGVSFREGQRVPSGEVRTAVGLTVDPPEEYQFSAFVT